MYFEGNSELLFIAQNKKNDSSELGSLIFYGIAKIFIDPVGLERNWASLNYVSKLKALVGLEKFGVIVFSIHVVQKMITQNFHFRAWFHIQK